MRFVMPTVRFNAMVSFPMEALTPIVNAFHGIAFIWAVSFEEADSTYSADVSFDSTNTATIIAKLSLHNGKLNNIVPETTEDNSGIRAIVEQLAERDTDETPALSTTKAWKKPRQRRSIARLRKATIKSKLRLLEVVIHNVNSAIA